MNKAAQALGRREEEKAMTLQFTTEEIEALSAVCQEHKNCFGCGSLPELNLETIIDTRDPKIWNIAMHQVDAERDLLANAVQATLEKAWPEVPRALISAAWKIFGGPVPQALVTHPPTGRVLKPWLLADALKRGRMSATIKLPTKCPRCSLAAGHAGACWVAKREKDPAAVALGSRTSAAKAAASRRNGAMPPRPESMPRGRPFGSRTRKGDKP